jgi:hypothetical protein
MDPIEVGMRLHVPLMQRIAKHVNSEEELREIGKMIDCFVGAAQVHAVEQGLSGTPQQYREYIAEKLQSMGLY